MNSFTIIVIFLVVDCVWPNTNIYFDETDVTLTYNSPCKLKGIHQHNGFCKTISECPELKELLKNRIKPTHCFFESNGPVLCCPITSLSESTTDGPVQHGQKNQPLKQRPSEARCLEQYPLPPPQEQGVIWTSVVRGEITKVGEFPYTAALGWTDTSGKVDYKCGGVLFESNFILTAAHCTDLRGVAPDVIRIGDGNLDNENQEFSAVDSILVHPKYTRRSWYNDIAIIKLSTNKTTVPIACLWLNNFKEVQNVDAIGYGHTEFEGNSSRDLLKATLKIFTTANCSEHYPPEDKLENGLIESQLCVGDPNPIEPKDTCQGDSGGPIVFKQRRDDDNRIIPYVVGITSYGQACAAGVPSIYTRISSYLDWIEPIVWS